MRFEVESTHIKNTRIYALIIETKYQDTTIRQYLVIAEKIYIWLSLSILPRDKPRV